MRKLNTISTYFDNEEKEKLEKAALLRNQSLSMYIKENIINILNNASIIPQTWVDKAKTNGFNDINEFINTAVNAYKLPEITAPDDSGELISLHSEISRLKDEIVQLKTPRKPLNDSERILNILKHAKGKYVSVDDLCEAIGVNDELDYNTEFLPIMHMNEDIEFNSKYGYRFKMEEK